MLKLFFAATYHLKLWLAKLAMFLFIVIIVTHTIIIANITIKIAIVNIAFLIHEHSFITFTVYFA